MVIDLIVISCLIPLSQAFATFIDEAAVKIRRLKQSMMSSSTMISSTNFLELSTEDKGTEVDELSQFSDLQLETKFNCAQQVDLSDNQLGKDRPDSRLSVRVSASPVRKQKFLNRNLNGLGEMGKNNRANSSNELLNGTNQVPATPSPAHLPAALAAHTNWVVVESLLREAKIKTKRILLEKMGSEEIAPLGKWA